MTLAPDKVDAPACLHTETACLNQHELIRKYRCEACAGVMMCACDEAFGRRFLSHQLSEGRELASQERVNVTLGFQPGVCAECRDLPAEPAPAGEIHGRTSKIKRYYWRELFFEEMRRKADWTEAHSDADAAERSEAHAAIDEQVLADIKALHATAPKYVIAEPSQSEILKRYGVEVLSIPADYVETPQKGAVIQDITGPISPEDFVSRHFEAGGWAVMPLESVPLHCLFGVMMWLLIEDPEDPRSRMVSFGDRAAYEAQREKPAIWTRHPEDFGSKGYALRRRSAIKRHFELIPPEREELLSLFDYWRPYSANLRQYLWAHREADVDRARRLVEVLPPETIKRILRHLFGDYWGRFLGWPDLLLHRGEEIMLLEVKSSSDKLSQDQKGWIADNHDHLHLPFKLVKLHRNTPKTRRTA
ncbi:MAG: hypothetical protein JWP35_1895 [Caulobacter sp.]|nr:hypothetical protein [Caulobacter sp.]